MRIAFFVDTFPALSETFILNQITALIDNGLKVDIYAAVDKRKSKTHPDYNRYKLWENTIYEEQWEGAYLKKFILTLRMCYRLLTRRPLLFFRIFFRNNRIFDYHLIRSILPVIDAPKYDIIHAHFGPNGVKVTKLQDLNLLTGPLICSFHGFDVDHINYRSNPHFYKGLFRSARIITGNSNYTIGNIKKLGCSAIKLKLVPETLYTNYFVKNDTIDTPSDSFKIITVARLVEFKGLQFSIMAIKKLIDRGRNNFNYSIIGDGPLRKILEEIVNENNLQNHITFFGAKDQDFIINQLSKSDLFVLTGIASSDGREENQGLVIQEAQSMELPVIVSRIGGVPEGMVDGITGFLVEPGNIETIADKIELLMNDESLRKQMGKKARKFVASKFDSDVKILELIEIYNQIIKNSPSRNSSYEINDGDK